MITNNERESITFESISGEALLFGGVDYDITIDGLMATSTITQYYTNSSDSNIEAVYTFPMDSDAILLGVDVTINDRKLRGTITEKKEAEAKYEKAIDEGNRAIMVEKRLGGLYTITIANILPKDKILVAIEYTQLLEWRGDRVRYGIPTTIAQKYGDPEELGLDDLSNPAISLFAENRFTLSMKVKGILAQGTVEAPSQEIHIDKNEAYTEITLATHTAFMDKDIRFLFTTDKKRDERSFVSLAEDDKSEGYAAVASFYPDFGIEAPVKPKSVTFVIDCSGSMHGLSIDRARTALHKAVNLLNEHDRFNVVKFGSGYSPLFDDEVPATQENLTIAKKMIRRLDADMGGTNMEEALAYAYRSRVRNREKGRRGYLFLITDGEIYDHTQILKSAKKSEMIHFVVGVGYAADSVLLSRLAKETRGSYEGMDPNEKMDDAILALFKKIDLPKAHDIRIEWPTEPLFSHTPGTLFDGDTLYATALFKTKPEGKVSLEYRLDDGSILHSSIEIGKAVEEERGKRAVIGTVIAGEIEALGELRGDAVDDNRDGVGTIIDLSVKYQLFSELTNYILVDEVAENEKPAELPKTQRVEHMVAESMMSSHKRAQQMQACMVAEDRNASEDFFDVPTFWRSCGEPVQIDEKRKTIFDRIDPGLYEVYLLLFDTWCGQYGRLPRKEEELRVMGLPEEIISLFTAVRLRRELRELVLELYSCCDHSTLSDAFIACLDKLRDKI